MPNIYYANDEFRCPGEVICRELEICKEFFTFKWHVNDDGSVQYGFFNGWENSPPMSAQDFMSLLDAFAAEDAYEKGCSCCGADLTSSNLAWVDGEPICITCASSINAVPWTSSVQDLLQ